MRATALNGYLLHQRPYQEKRAIYQFFSHEQGVVHGVGARGMPLFAPIWLMSSGAKSLKSFSQISLGFSDEFAQQLKTQSSEDTWNQASYGLTTGRVQYALLYMNEVLYKLLATESPCPELWQVYHANTAKLHALDRLTLSPADEMQAMKLYLRSFERALFSELGVGMDFYVDGHGTPINADAIYYYIPQMGFVLDHIALTQTDRQIKVGGARYTGAQILQMGAAIDDPELALRFLNQLSQIQKELLDDLLGYQPLHSRTLWQQSIQYLQ
ncbi:DNA repair protein RecO [Moraxella canis]|uniref:DNA repair protein RecO n=1 Tax=Moraxella canis TaxID=90239 RepID=UPI0006684A9B|nr:DNA repair protein RecO C-terminal domain-containing protein [Moraxella canis]